MFPPRGRRPVEKRRWLKRLFPAAALLALATGPSSPAQAASDQSWGTGEASGFRQTVIAPNYIVGGDVPVDTGGPVAEVGLDLLGNSTGFASMPYPGALAVSAPGLASGTAGAPVPDYPLYVSSRFPNTPTATTDAPGYRLHAESTADSSVASAASGSQESDNAIGSSVASAETHRDESGVIHVQSKAEVQSVNIAGVLLIGQLSATAEVRQAPGESVQRSSHMSIGDVAVAGIHVGVTDQGLSLPGGNVPLPAASPVTDVLNEAHITIRYLAPIEDRDGIVSAGVEVSFPIPLPNASASTAILVFGRAAAHGGSGALGPTSSGLNVEPGEMTPGAATVLGEGSDSFVAGAGQPRVGTLTSPHEQRTVIVNAAPAAAVQVSGSTFYLVLVVGGAFAVACMQLVRHLGVKLRGASSRWT